MRKIVLLIGFVSLLQLGLKAQNSNVLQIGLSAPVGELSSNDGLYGGFASSGFYLGYEHKRHLGWRVGFITVNHYTQHALDESLVNTAYEQQFSIQNVNYSGGPYRSLTTTEGLYIDVVDKNGFVVTLKGGVGLGITYFEDQTLSWTEPGGIVTPPSNKQQEKTVQLGTNFNSYGGASLAFKFTEEVGIGFDISYTYINNATVKLVNPTESGDGRSPNIVYLNVGLNLLLY